MIKKTLFFALLAVLAATGGCRSREPQTALKETPSQPVSKPERTGDKKTAPKVRIRYLITSGDVLAVNVWENSDLDREVVVRPDGMISFPLIDEIEAEGLTISELDKQLTKKLKEFIRHPDVSISLKKMAPSKTRVLVLGEVKNPGIYSLESRKTVLGAIALAGGTTRDAVMRSVMVVSGGMDNPRAKRVNISAALKKARLDQDIALAAQDIVYVPRVFVADVSRFLGHILDPILKSTSIHDSLLRWGED